MVREMKSFAKGKTFKIEDANQRYALAFGWGNTFLNWMSTGGVVTVTEFEPCAPHALGAFDLAGEALYSRGVVQPTIGAPGGQFVLGGNPIARPEYYREDSCMLSLFMEWGADRLKTHRDHLNHEGLYKLATGKELVEGAPAGVTLREAEKWLALWRLSGRAIDQSGKLVWSYDPPSRNNRVVGGTVWRLLIHNKHVWLCNVDPKSFDKIYGGAEVVPPKPVISPDISKTLSDKWKRPPEPTGELLEIVTDAKSVLALPARTLKSWRWSCGRPDMNPVISGLIWVTSKASPFVLANAL